MERINLNSRGFGIAGSSNDARNYNTAYSDYAVSKHNLSQSAHSELFKETRLYTDENIALVNSEMACLNSDIQSLTEMVSSEAVLRSESDESIKKSFDEYAYSTNATLEDNETRISALEQARIETADKIEALRADFITAIDESWEAEV